MSLSLLSLLSLLVSGLKEAAAQLSELAKQWEAMCNESAGGREDRWFYNEVSTPSIMRCLHPV